ncbi:MAG: cation transporter, partial [Bacteroidota bacterium]
EHSGHWFQWIASGALVLLLINGYVLKFVEKRRSGKAIKLKKEHMTRQIHTFRVEGMTCSHCKASVENGLSALSSVSGAVADPAQNQVAIEAEGVTEAEVRETVEGLGYIFKGRT